MARRARSLRDFSQTRWRPNRTEICSNIPSQTPYRCRVKTRGPVGSCRLAVSQFRPCDRRSRRRGSFASFKLTLSRTRKIVVGRTPRDLPGVQIGFRRSKIVAAGRKRKAKVNTEINRTLLECHWLRPTRRATQTQGGALRD